MEDNLQALGENSSLRDEFIVPVFVYSPFPKGGEGDFSSPSFFNRPALSRRFLVICRRSEKIHLFAMNL